MMNKIYLKKYQLYVWIWINEYGFRYKIQKRYPIRKKFEWATIIRQDKSRRHMFSIISRIYIYVYNIMWVLTENVDNILSLRIFHEHYLHTDRVGKRAKMTTATVSAGYVFLETTWETTNREGNVNANCTDCR